jgi:ABC-type uncharacterized transport system substrate-binding protein
MLWPGRRVVAVRADCCAQAHPHVFARARVELVFEPSGLLTAIRHSWTFDEAYSSFLLQGLGTAGQPATREQLAPVAKSNVESIAAYEDFTTAKAAGRQSVVGSPVDDWLEEKADKRAVLHFTLPLRRPASAAKIFTLLVYDPTYSLAFSFEDRDPIGLSEAPDGLFRQPLEAEAARRDQQPETSRKRRCSTPHQERILRSDWPSGRSSPAHEANPSKVQVGSEAVGPPMHNF